MGVGVSVKACSPIKQALMGNQGTTTLPLDRNERAICGFENGALTDTSLVFGQ